MNQMENKTPPTPLQEAAEKEVMIQAFDKVRKLFESRSWIMEGRGSYRYDDDRYKEEVRYLYDEFDALQKDVWANIKTKSFEFRQKIISEWQSNQPQQGVDDWISIDDELPDELSDGRILCWCEEINDLGMSYFFWNCSYSKRHGFTDGAKPYSVTHWKRITPPAQ